MSELTRVFVLAAVFFGFCGWRFVVAHKALPKEQVEQNWWALMVVVTLAFSGLLLFGGWKLVYWLFTQPMSLTAPTTLGGWLLTLWAVKSIIRGSIKPSVGVQTAIDPQSDNSPKISQAR